MIAKFRGISTGVGLFLGLAVLLMTGLAAYRASAVKQHGARGKRFGAKGIVTDSQARPIVDAKVFFIDSKTINTTPITPASIVDGRAEAYDEPLEDIIRDPVKAKALPQAVTDKSGKFRVKSLDANLKYFTFVSPGEKDVDHLPGGDASRIAFSPKALPKTGLAIQVSWKPPADATYIGTSACYVCHGTTGPGEDVTSNKHHGHSLFFHRPEQDTANQDSAAHVGSNWNALTNKFTLASQPDLKKAPVAIAPSASVEVLYFQDFDKKQSNQFVVYENTPVSSSAVHVKAYLWKTADGKYNVTLENVIKPTDPNNFVTLAVPLTMGGYIRQLICLTVPSQTPDGQTHNLKATYRFLTYQALPGSASQGLQNNYDRTRKPFYGSFTSFTDFYDTTTNLLKFPTNKTSNISCAACHLGFGTYEKFTDSVTGEALAHTVADPNGVFDLGGDGSLQDVGVSCEQCHGPGSRHREEALKTLAPASTKSSARKTAQPVITVAKFIVNPKLLGADRASLICGRCHSQRGILESEEENFAPVGISRADFLAGYVNPVNKGALPANLWQDGIFPKGGHHGFHYSDWLISKHSRNSRQMVACDDCHDAMGDSPYRYALKGDPDNSTTGLCLTCHAKDVSKHVLEKTGSVMMGESMACIQCHMQRTGKGGAGRPGLLLATPAGVSTDANIEYWQGDQSSHTWIVPRKFDPGVAGVRPGDAMPIPYTNSCGTCHDSSKLQYQAPDN